MISDEDMYTKKYKYLKELKRKINFCSLDKDDGSYKKSVELIHGAMETIWDPSERLIKNFTDHGVGHSDRVAHNILCLLEINNTIELLNDRDKYLLLVSIYLHDIGMQCDLIKFKGVLDKAKTDYQKVASDLNFDFASIESNDLNYFVQEKIRKHHHILTVLWLDVLREPNGNSVLHKAAKKIPEECLEDIKLICKYHSKLKFPSIEEMDKEEKKKCLLAALLRFGDELDIARDRVSLDMYEAFRVATENSKYWWLHQHTKINHDELKKGLIDITYYLNPEDNECQEDIKSWFKINFLDKNEHITEILKEYNIELKSKVKVKESEKCNRIDKMLKSAIKEFDYECKPYISDRQCEYQMIRSLKTLNKGPNNEECIFSFSFNKTSEWSHELNQDKENLRLYLRKEKSFINIDVVKIGGHGIRQILNRNRMKKSWEDCYKKYSWIINTDVGDHYCDYIIKYNNWDRSHSFGTGVHIYKGNNSYSPLIDDITYPFYVCRYNRNEPNNKMPLEWIIAWTNPEYEDRIIGIHASFEENVGTRKVRIGGENGPLCFMQEALYSVLNSINFVDISPNASSSTKDIQNRKEIPECNSNREVYTGTSHNDCAL